jgi:glycosyltransferase involved in cell wall biosynthesis
MTPKLSIIIPVYNVEKYLRECLDSVVAQTFTDWECILVDDGSKDSSPAICDEYAQRDARFRVIHTTNGGQGRARNLGLGAMQGEYVTFVDSDDLLIDRYSHANCIAIMENDRSIDIVQYSYVEFSDPRAIVDKPKKPDQLMVGTANILEHFGIINCKGERGIYPGPCFKIFRSSLFRTIRFPEGRIYEDAWMLADLFEITHKFLITDCGCYAYRHHDASTTHSGISPIKFAQRMEMYIHVFELLRKHSVDMTCQNQFFWTVMFRLIVAKIYFGKPYGKEFAKVFARHLPKGANVKQYIQITLVKLLGLNALLNIRSSLLRFRNYTEIVDL